MSARAMSANQGALCSRLCTHTLGAGGCRTHVHNGLNEGTHQGCRCEQGKELSETWQTHTRLPLRPSSHTLPPAHPPTHLQHAPSVPHLLRVVGLLLLALLLVGALRHVLMLFWRWTGPLSCSLRVCGYLVIQLIQCNVVYFSVCSSICDANASSLTIVC